MAPNPLREGLGGIASRVPTALGDAAFQLRVFTEVGIVRPIRPDKLARVAERYIRWGASPALGSTANAITHPNDAAIVDQAGTLTWEETHRRSNALARALRDEGVGLGDGVAIMCRNHRYFIEATMACSKLGAVALYLNTAFAGPQLADGRAADLWRPHRRSRRPRRARALHHPHLGHHRHAEGSPAQPAGGARCP